MSLTKWSGVTFRFNSEVELVIPPLSLGAIEQLQGLIAKMDGQSKVGIDARVIIEVTHAALHRNYPEMKREDVAALIDLQNALNVWSAVMNVSGISSKPKGSAPGEAIAP